jgi:hypothetical protein
MRALGRGGRGGGQEEGRGTWVDGGRWQDFTLKWQLGVEGMIA